MTISTNAQNWQTICQKQDLIKHSGVCALINEELQLAIFHTAEDQVHSISNWDPAGQANVLYRGIIGDSDGEIFVASPLYKERFSLTTGQCLDDESLTVTSYQTRIHGEQVQILV